MVLMESYFDSIVRSYGSGLIITALLGNLGVEFDEYAATRKYCVLIKAAVPTEDPAFLIRLSWRN